MGLEGKSEVVPSRLAKGSKSKGAPSGDVSWGSLRFQDYTSGGKDVIHVHDDAKNLVFEYNGVADFRTILEKFFNERHLLKEAIVAIRGTTHGKSGSRTYADIIFHCNASGQWQMTLEPAGSSAEYEIGGDPLIEFLRDWRQRIG